MGLITDTVRANWGEWAVGALVALAVIHLIRKWFFKKKTGGDCCNKGCSLPPPGPKK
jgi:hypothetical protein